METSTLVRANITETSYGRALRGSTLPDGRPYKSWLWWLSLHWWPVLGSKCNEMPIVLTDPSMKIFANTFFIIYKRKLYFNFNNFGLQGSPIKISLTNRCSDNYKIWNETPKTLKAFQSHTFCNVRRNCLRKHFRNHTIERRFI